MKKATTSKAFGDDLTSFVSEIRIKLSNNLKYIK